MKSDEEKKQTQDYQILDYLSDMPYNENLTHSKEGTFVVSSASTYLIPEGKYPN